MAKCAKQTSSITSTLSTKARTAKPSSVPQVLTTHWPSNWSHENDPGMS